MDRNVYRVVEKQGDRCEPMTLDLDDPVFAAGIAAGLHIAFEQHTFVVLDSLGREFGLPNGGYPEAAAEDSKLAEIRKCRETLNVCGRIVQALADYQASDQRVATQESSHFGADSATKGQ